VRGFSSRLRISVVLTAYCKQNTRRFEELEESEKPRKISKRIEDVGQFFAHLCTYAHKYYHMLSYNPLALALTQRLPPPR
jgi:hypothetical protein